MGLYIFLQVKNLNKTPTNIELINFKQNIFL